MAYQVWTKDEFEGWKRKDCSTLEAAQGEILLAIKSGKEPLLTEELPFGIDIWIKEEKVREIVKGEAKPGEGPGAEGKGKVRRGATEPVSEVG